MNKKYGIKDFHKWVSCICPYGNRKNFIELAEASGGNGNAEEKIRIYTDNYIYTIKAVERKNDNGGYLGCIMSCRKQRVGENHFRGNDLPDGYLNPKTWNRIKNAIIRNELVSY